MSDSLAGDGATSGCVPPADSNLAVVLKSVLQRAQEITRARYAALAVMSDEAARLEHFLTLGVDAETRRAIGHPPRGRGVLGHLIVDPRPLCVADVREHPHSYGFPQGHPVMRSFLGVPILIRGYAWGSLHLAEKTDGEFTEADTRATVGLAEEAAGAIRFERRYRGRG